MKLSKLLKKYNAYDFFINNFDKDKFNRENAFLVNLNHVDDSSIPDEDWGKDYDKNTHPFILATEYFEENEDNIELDMNETLDIIMPKLILIKFESNWADEMDIEGHYIDSIENWKSFKSAAKQYLKHFDLSYCIGTNEEIEFMSYKELMDCYTTKPISKSEFKSFVFFGLESSGFTGPEIDMFEPDKDDD